MGKHCGYQGEGFISKASRLLIPDNPFGVNISQACKAHDYGWIERQDANKHSDIQLRDDILDSFYMHVNKKDWSEANKTLFFFLLGYPTAWVYFLGVRIGGIPVKIKVKIVEMRG